mmetsp:Transcript_14916/g.17950  ORF Transcript_14916/g.17950 Transcript_14916/m.17950 type:complete len:189 (-) Transcript_14916:189-755(-)
MVSDSFHTMESAYKGVDQNELKHLVVHLRKQGEDLQADMLGKVFLVGEGHATFIASVPENNHFVNVVLLYARRQDGKYDLLIAKGEQKKELNGKKLAVAAGGAAALSAGAGGFSALSRGAGTLSFLESLPVSPPLVAGAVFLLLLGGIGWKTKNDYCEPIENVVNGFLLASLEKKGLIEISDNGVKMK